MTEGKKKRKKSEEERSVSLFPLSTDEALADLMKVKPEPKKKRLKKRPGD